MNLQPENTTQNKKSSAKNAVLIIVLIALVCTLFELIIANSVQIKLAMGGYKHSNIDISQSNRKIPDNEELDEIEITGINIPAATLDIKFSGAKGYGKLEIYMQDENFAYRYEKAGDYRFFNDAKGSYCSFNINPAGKLKALKIVFGDDCEDLLIEKIELNRTPPLAFNFLRFFTVFFIASSLFLIIKYKVYAKVYNSGSHIHRAFICTAVILCMLCSVFVGVFTYQDTDDGMAYKYPLDSQSSSYGLYTLQFDAFLKGQLNLDAKFDNEALESLDNPYDNSDRKENASGNGALWDSAYYNGKLYSYFGAAPFVFIYYPFYLIFRAIPTEHTVSLILSIFGSLFISLAFLELQKYFCKKPPLILTVLGIFAVNLGSLIYVCQSNFNMYYIACMSGIAFTALFIYTSFRAVRTENSIKRNIIFALSAISCASIVASRPILVLYALIVVPVFISFLLNKDIDKKNKILSVSSFFVPLVILGTVIMWYNYARFGSPFQFGAIYNLTVSDTSKNNIRLFLFFPAMYHVFFQAPYFNSEFPFIHTNMVNLHSYRSYMYVQSTIGALSYPATWGLFTAGTALKGKQNRVKRLTVLSAVLSLIAVAFVGTCMGGVHFRYSTDVVLISVLFGLVLLNAFVSEIKANAPYLYNFFFALACALCLLTVIIGLAVIFDNERDMIFKLHPQVFNIFESVFK